MNLSEQKARSSRQRERIGRRSSIIDERRDTRAPSFRGSQTMRTARRGEAAGAESLLRSLGMAQEAGSQFADYSMRQHADDEQANMARGFADEAAGTVDEELMAKSDGYHNAVTKGRTVTAFSEASREFNKELADFIEQQDSPSLEVRQAEVSALIEGFYRNFAQDPDTGELRENLQSPGAARYLAEAIQQSRPDAVAQAQAAIEDKFNTEALEHYGQNLVDQLADTGTLDVNRARELLPDTVSDEQIAEATLVSVGNAMERLKDEGRLDQVDGLADALRGYSDAPRPSTAPTATPSGTAPAPASSGGDAALLRSPVEGRITGNMGDARSGGRSHNGIDIAVPVGTPVPAAMGGEVLRVWTADAGGLSVKVKYDDGTVVGLAHLDNTDLKAGQRIAPGDVIALTGNSGKSTGPHLHYTVTQDGQKVDPANAEFGEVPAEVQQSAPEFRLRDPNEDPLDAIARDREPMEIVGLEDIQFTQAQRARIGEFVDAQQAEIRREQKRQRQDFQSSNATTLSLGVLGIGGFTSTQDIMDAYDREEISAEQVFSLARLKEQRMEKQEREREREETRRERELHKARQEYGQNLIDGYLGRFYRGDVSGAELRETVLSEAANLGDPEVASALISATNSAVSGYESALTNSAPVRQQQRLFKEEAANAGSWVASLSIPRSRQSDAAQEWVNAIDRANAKYMEMILDGESPEDAMRAAARVQLREKNRIVNAYTFDR